MKHATYRITPQAIEDHLATEAAGTASWSRMVSPHHAKAGRISLRLATGSLFRRFVPGQKAAPAPAPDANMPQMSGRSAAMPTKYTLTPGIPALGTPAQGIPASGGGAADQRGAGDGAMTGAPCDGATSLSIRRKNRRYAIGYAVAAAAWLAGTRAALAFALASDIIGPDVVRWVMDATLAILFLSSCLLILRHFEGRSGMAERLQLMTEAANGACATIDPDGMIEYANDAFLRLLSLSTFAPGHLPVEALLGPYRKDGGGAPLLPPSGARNLEIILANRQSSARKITLTIRKLVANGRDFGWLLTAPGTPDSPAEQWRDTMQARALDTAAEGIVIADLRAVDLPVVYVNKAFLDITGYAQSDVLGRNIRFLQGCDRQQPQIDQLRDAIARRQPISATLRNYRKDGTLFWNQVRLTPVHDEPVYDKRGEPSHYIGVMRDVTELRHNAEELHRLAATDPVTALANRASFVATTDQLLRGCAPRAAADSDTAQQDGCLLLLTFDIAGFPDIVASHGQEAGDALLREIADRLRAIPGGHAARLGDQCFGLALERGDDAAADGVVSDVHAVLCQPVRLPGGEAELRFASGWTTGRAGADAGTLLRQALVAQRQSHWARSGVPHRFNVKAEEDIRRRVRISRDLQHAIRTDNFVLKLQPVVAVGDCDWLGAEALVRWRHPAFGLQASERFITISEQNGQILAIGEWAFRQAAAFAASLAGTAGPSVAGTAGGPLVISVNMAQAQLEHPDLLATLAMIIHEAGVDPAMLRLEVAATVLAACDPARRAQLTGLRDIGLGLVIDDFGDDPSILPLLAPLPVTEVKTTSALVRGCDTSDAKRAALSACVAVAEPLGIAVTAKGVEHAAERQMLARLGIRRAQGFLFSEALDMDAFAAELRRRARTPVGAA